MNEVIKKRDKAKNDLKKLEQGSVWKSSSLLGALKLIFFPDYYYGAEL